MEPGERHPAAAAATPATPRTPAPPPRRSRPNTASADAASQVRGGRGRREGVGAGEHQLPHHLLERPAVFADEAVGEMVQQSGVRGPGTGDAEVVGRGDQAPAEQVHPHAVDGHARRERVGGVGDPAGQFPPAAGLRVDRGRAADLHGRQEAAGNAVAEVLEVALDLDPHVSGLGLHHPHRVAHGLEPPALLLKRRDLAVDLLQFGGGLRVGRRLGRHADQPGREPRDRVGEPGRRRLGRRRQLQREQLREPAPSPPTLPARVRRPDPTRTSAATAAAMPRNKTGFRIRWTRRRPGRRSRPRRASSRMSASPAACGLAALDGHTEPFPRRLTNPAAARGRPPPAVRRPRRPRPTRHSAACGFRRAGTRPPRRRRRIAPRGRAAPAGPARSRRARW